MPDLDNNQPIDLNDPAYQAMFLNLQGNILKGHGRDHTVHIFIKLDTGDVANTRARLAAFATKVVTSARQQSIEAKEFHDFGIPGALFGNIFLTAKGYVALGFTIEELKAALIEEEDPSVLSNFLEGMQAHSDELNDPPPNEWDAGYREGEIDAMVLLADDDEHYLLRQARLLINELQSFSRILVIERGNALRRPDNDEGIEHFGYVDGRSQPIYLAAELAKEGDITKWNPFEPLKRVLVRDGNVADENCHGSFFVFRKLEQDVLRFKVREQELADKLEFEGDERARAGALAVGRFQDGTPVVLSQTDGFVPPKENNFKYDDDPKGFKCPFHAHIRKTNPRGESGDEAERRHRITRRGITYGRRNRHPDFSQALEDLPSTGVGLLFMCFQASIATQFAFIQKLWANNPGFLSTDVGIDPVIGQSKSGSAPLEQKWPRQWGPQPDPSSGGTKPPDMDQFSFAGFVTMKGGEFFFAPSIPFLKGL